MGYPYAGKKRLSAQTDDFFQKLSSLQAEYDQRTALDMMCRYCLQSDSAYTQRIGLEFLYANSYFSELQQLINMNKAHTNPANREWGRVYQVAIDRNENGSRIEMLHQLRQIKTKDPELKCVIEFTKAFLYLDMNQIGQVGNFLDMQPRLFSNVKDVYLLSCFHNRLHQYLFMYHWSRNELIIARKYAFQALTQTNSDFIKASIHINLGLTYTFDTYQQGMYHLNEAIRLAKESGAENMINAIKIYNIPFLSAHFGETEGIETVDSSEQAHLEIARGNLDKAIAILEKLPLSNPFDLYYMGLAKQNKDLLTASYNYFIEKQGDLFFARLPLNAMKKLFGESFSVMRKI